MNKDKPWLEFYEPHVPEHIEYPQKTLIEAMEETTQKFSDHTATIYKNRKVTYGEQLEAINRFAAALQLWGGNHHHSERLLPNHQANSKRN